MKEIRLSKAYAEKLGVKEKEGYLTYNQMLKYYNVDLILCNDIVKVEGFEEECYEAIMNMLDSEREEELNTLESIEDEEEREEKKEEINSYYDNCNIDIFQYYIISANNYDIEDLKEAGEIIAYNEFLDINVLCVTHWGTGWDYVGSNVKYVVESED